MAIDSLTGAITPSASSAGIYTVTYTIAAQGGCAVFTTTASVVIVKGATAAITYSGSPFCTSLTTPQQVTFTGATGGTYSSSVGLTIDPLTGNIIPSTSILGTYIVTYTIPAAGACPAFLATTSVTITNGASATISYTGTPFCTSLSTDQQVILTGTGGGTFTSTPGLSINSTTGAITPSTSTAGTYTVTYSIAASGTCAAFSTTTAVTIITGPTATIVYSDSWFCSSVSTAQTATLTGTTGGTFSSTTGLTIDSLTGAIIPFTSTAGTYIVTYKIPASGPCAAFSTTVTIIIKQAPATPAVISNSPVCYTTSINLSTASIGNYTYSWSGPNGFTSSDQNPTLLNATAAMSGTYSVTATESGCASLPGTVTVLTVDCKPAANVDVVSVLQNTTTPILVLANDTDPQGNLNSASVSIVTSPKHGTAVADLAGIITYSPTANYLGKDTLIYQVCDQTTPTPFCDTAIVYITVVPVNVSPVVNDTVITTAEDHPISVCLPILNGVSGQVYTVTSCGGPLNGTSSSVINGSQVCITYTPKKDFNGKDSLCILVCNAGLFCDTAHVIVNVTPVNDSVIVNDTMVTTTINIPVTVCLPIRDHDIGQTYVVSSCGDPLNGSAVSWINGNWICVTYTPKLGFTGWDSLCVMVCESGSNVCDTAMVRFRIAPINHPPVVNDTSITSQKNNIVNLCLPIGDWDSDQSFTVTSCKNPLNGTASYSIVGKEVCITYTPDKDFTGNDTLCINICDNGFPSMCDAARVFFKIKPDPETPVIFIPEGISPNGDNVNDHFVIKGIENYPKNKLMILNRWGNKIFDAKPYENNWDGTNRLGITVGSDELPEGTYYYILNLGDGSKEMTGYIYLTR